MRYIEHDTSCRIIDDNGLSLCESWLTGDEECDATARNNLRLFAAAPELLAACQAAVVWANDVPPPYRDWPFIQAIRAAIAKATGTE